jgi:hypothetical protein
MNGEGGNAMKKLLGIIIALCLWPILSYGQYNRNGALMYAASWCNSKNPNYDYFGNWRQGGDCSNFISQCLIAGGMNIYYPASPWQRRRGGTFSLVYDLKNYLEQYCGAPYNNTDLNCVEPGDVVFFRNTDGRFVHAAIVRTVDKVNMRITYSSHSQRPTNCDKQRDNANDSNLFYYHILPFYILFADWDGGGTSTGWYYNGSFQGYGWVYCGKSFNYEFRGYSQFDVSEIGSTDPVIRAYLRLHNNQASGPLNLFNVNLRYVTNIGRPTWSECGGVTYGSFPVEPDPGDTTWINLTATSAPQDINVARQQTYPMWGLGYNAPDGDANDYKVWDGYYGLSEDIQLRVLLDDGCAGGPRPPGGGPQGDKGQSYPKLPQELQLSVVSPFTSSTKITYQLPNEGNVVLKLYDIKGGVVRTLLSQRKQAGSHSVIWNGKTDAGNTAPGGVYFLKLEALGTQKVVRTVLVR